MRIISRQEFSSQRRTALDDAERFLADAVTEALKQWGETHWWEPAIDRAELLYEKVYKDESGADQVNLKSWRRLAKQLSTSLGKTKEPDEHTAEVVTRFLATGTLNAATVQAAHDDPETLELEWVTMHDRFVRVTHEKADGQRRKEGEPFHVGESEMMFPGDTTAPPEEWIGCRCVLRPDLPAEEKALVAAASGQDVSQHAVVVALPHKDDPVHGLGPEQAHVTLAYLGHPDNSDPEALHREVAQVASKIRGPFEDNVSGRAELGPDKANVLLLDGQHLGGVRAALLDQPSILAAHDAATQHPNFTPHLTLGYPGQGDISQDSPEKVGFDRLAVWHGGQQTEFSLGDDMPEENETAEPEAPTEGAPEQAGMEPIPWYGVLTVEGAPSGDKRSFAKDSLVNRDLPLRLTWQKAADQGHRGSVVVGSIESIYRFVGEGDQPNEIRGTGHYLQSPEADEVVGQHVAFGNMGVSVDLDDVTFDFDVETESVNFTKGRICSASAVTIPAFAQALIYLGEAPAGYMGDDAQAVDNPVETEAAAAAVTEAGRGPGWVTNPKSTKRLHDYWTVPGQPGYEKIAWGTGGDFNRCRVEIGEEIGESDPAKLRFINQQCAQWHKDALGYWPATHAKRLGHSAEEVDLGDAQPVSVSLVASVGTDTRTLPKAEWTNNPHLPCPTPLTYIDAGNGFTRVVGHLGEWATCHLDFPGVCVTPPPLDDNGDNFMLGRVETDQGLINVGTLTLGGGHADEFLNVHAAKAHYDDVSTGVAEVRVGTDEFGIWFAGWLRPWVTEQQRYELLASKLSGDWRDTGMGRLDLIAAHAVNTPGFGIKPSSYVHNGQQLSLVAAGGLEPRTVQEAIEINAGENGLSEEAAANLIAAGIQRYVERQEARARIVAAAAKVGASPKDRINAAREFLEV